VNLRRIGAIYPLTMTCKPVG